MQVSVCLYALTSQCKASNDPIDTAVANLLRRRLSFNVIRIIKHIAVKFTETMANKQHAQDCLPYTRAVDHPAASLSPIYVSVETNDSCVHSVMLMPFISSMWDDRHVRRLIRQNFIRSVNWSDRRSICDFRRPLLPVARFICRCITSTGRDVGSDTIELTILAKSDRVRGTHACKSCALWWQTMQPEMPDSLPSATGNELAGKWENQAAILNVLLHEGAVNAIDALA